MEKKKGVSNSGRCFADISLSRRDFLKIQAKATLAIAAGANAGLLVPAQATAQAIPDIVVAKGGPEGATKAAVEAMGGMGAFVKPGDTVVIKPNMSFGQPPQTATNTHPEVVKALAGLCEEAGAVSVLVLDNPLDEAGRCLEMSGVQEACAGLPRTSVHMFSSGRFFEKVTLERGRSLKETEVMKAVIASDVLIAVPVAKTHFATGVSLSMKGMMGLIRNRGVMHRSHDLSSAIVDLCTFLRADLTVIDATRVLTTHGPSGPGKVAKEDTIIVSKDMVAADAMTVNMFSWYGRDIYPSQVAHIREANERGLGRMDIENLDVRRVTF
ncbi:MAG: DUF362 domain-containing protein [Syntrophales bacterium]|nr:DUF362 domain-containing protein [Syntrophales bacterium]